MGACTKGLSKGSSYTMKPSSSTETLLAKLTMNISINGILTFVAIIGLLASIHSLYLYQLEYRLRYETTPVLDSKFIDSKSEKDEESQAPYVSEGNGRIPSLVGKTVTSLAAGFYIAFNWYGEKSTSIIPSFSCTESIILVTLATAAEHKGPGLMPIDGYLRSGIAGCAVCRFYSSEEAVY